MWTIDGLTYSRRKAIAISHANVTSALNNFALCLQISGDTDIGAVCRSDGADLRFTTQSGTLLYAEKESFAVSSGAASGLFWVGVPAISNTADTTIYCYYGNSGASAQSNPQFLYDLRFKAVWHLGQSAAPFADSTTYANSGSASSSPPTQATGILAKAQHFHAASDQYISVPDSTSLEISGAGSQFTVSAWINLDSIPSTHSYDILCKGWDTTSYELRVAPSGYGVVGFMDASQNEHQLTTGGIVFPSTGTWYHVAGVFDGSYLRFYVNGTQQASLAVSANPGTDSEALTIGSLAGQSAFCFDGLLDEVRVSNYARPGAWMKFEYYNQKDSSGQLTWGPEQRPGGRRLIDGSLASGTQLTAILAE
jgi:hypothetical protein